MAGGLRVRDLVVMYQADQGSSLMAVQQISLNVEEGEKLAVVGPSGCGKSTLLLSIAGFIAPASGSIQVGERTVRAPGIDRMVVFQGLDQLLPWRSVLGNITYPLRVTGRARGARAREIAERYVRLMGLAGFENALAHQLSGGMKQRVAIARALAVEPDVCLMDEPFASVDAITRRELQDLVLAAFQGTPRILVLVTHAIEEAVFLGDSIAVLSARPARVKRVVKNRAVGQRSGAAFDEVRAEVESLLAGEPTAVNA